MVSTLIKHEISRTARWLGIIALAAVLVVGAATAGVFIVGGPVGILMAALACVVAAALPAGIQIWQGVDLYRTSYTKTGYLTRALPVKGSTIYWVKLGYAYVVGLIFMLLSVGLIVVVSFGIVHLTGGTAGDVIEALREAWRLVSIASPTWLLVAGGLVVLIAPLTGLAQYYFAVTVGSEAWAGKLGIGGPLIVWFSYYVVSQVVAVLGLFLPVNLVFGDFPNPPHWSFDPLAWLQAGGEGVVPIGMVLMALAMTAVAIVWASVSFDRKVELR